MSETPSESSEQRWPAIDGVTPDSVNAFAHEQWPSNPNLAHCLEVSGRHAVVHVPVLPETLRPGGFVSGPTQFAAADVALWYACFGAIGLEAMALTSELSIRFLRPAIGDSLHARADLSSVGGRRLAGSVTVWTNDMDRPTSIAQGTYMAPR